MLKFEIHHLKQCSSTNEEAKNFPPYHAVIAETQIAGKGRNGRKWESFSGNLFLSLTLPLPSNASAYSFITALAVAETLGFLSPRIKWPNDVLIDNKKISGILLETTEKTLIIGIGVNIEKKPETQMLYQTTCLKEYNASLPPKELADKILQNLSFEINLFEQKGFSAIRQQWLEYATGIGKPIQVRLPQEVLQGTFEGLDNTGALILKQNTTIRYITAGDIFMI